MGLRTPSEQVEVPKPSEQLGSQPQTEVQIFLAPRSPSLQRERATFLPRGREDRGESPGREGTLLLAGAGVWDETQRECGLESRCSLSASALQGTFGVGGRSEHPPRQP